MPPDSLVRQLLVCLTAGLIAGCGAAPPPQMPPPQVTVARPVVEDVFQYVNLTGHSHPSSTFEARARVQGYLVSAPFEEGSYVKQGDLLFEIERDQYEAALAEAKANKALSEAEAHLAKQNEARERPLRERGSISEQQYETRVAELNSALARIEAGEAAIRQAEISLGYTRIMAPFDGIVGFRNVDPGNLVGVGEQTLLATVLRYDPLRIEFDVSERQALTYVRRIAELVEERAQNGDAEDWERPELPIWVGFEEEQGFPHTGRVDVIQNQIDPNTGTIAVRGVIPNTFRSQRTYKESGQFVDWSQEDGPPGPLIVKPGAYALVRVETDPVEQAVLVDERAIGTDLLGKYLLVVDAEGTVHQRRIEQGQLYRGFRHIVRMWDPDEAQVVGEVDTRGTEFTPDFQYIVRGLQRARPGSKVEFDSIDLEYPDEPEAEVPAPEADAAP